MVALPLGCVWLLVLDGDTESVLENTLTRNLFLDDLHELREFLSRRSYELASDSSSPVQVGGWMGRWVGGWVGGWVDG